MPTVDFNIDRCAAAKTMQLALAQAEVLV